MDELITELTRGLAPAIWVVPTAYLLIKFFRRRDDEKIEMERLLRMKEKEERSYLDHKLSREHDIEDRYSPKVLEEVFNQIGGLRRDVSSLDSKLERTTVVNNTFHDESSWKQDGLSSGSPEQLVRELSHSLNTPLAQIEAAASSAIAILDSENEAVGSLRSVSDCVQVCKAFLGAYRELVLSGPTSVWNPSSIEGAVETACNVYAASKNKDLNFELSLPKKIHGYSNNYVTALILPILENAIESSQQNTSTRVSYLQKTETNEIHIRNRPAADPGGEEIYEQGYTTKDGHEGTGLTSVKRLLSTHEGASLTHNFNSGVAAFLIKLPRRIQ